METNFNETNNPMMMNQMEMKINPMMMNLMINQMNMMTILNNNMMNNENNGGNGGYQNNNFKDRFGNPKKVYFSFHGNINEKTINIYKNDDYNSLYNKLHKILESAGKKLYRPAAPTEIIERISEKETLEYLIKRGVEELFPRIFVINKFREEIIVFGKCPFDKIYDGDRIDFEIPLRGGGGPFC